MSTFIYLLLFILSITIDIISSQTSVTDCTCGKNFFSDTDVLRGRKGKTRKGKAAKEKKKKKGRNNNAKGRISGGTDALSFEFPWQVGFFNKVGGSVYCGGTIFNDRYILTAAHCFEGKAKENLIAIIGRQIMYSLEEMRTQLAPPEERNINKIVIHPSYESPKIVNDIGIAQLEKPITEYFNYIAPLCLPISTTPVDEVDAIIIGWGQKDVNGTKADILQKSNVKLLPNGQCADLVGDTYDQELLMCISTQLTQTCEGDGGGSLMYKNDQNQYIEIGVISMGEDGCGNVKSVSVFTKVNKYFEWMTGETMDAQFCKNLIT